MPAHLDELGDLGRNAGREGETTTFVCKRGEGRESRRSDKSFSARLLVNRGLEDKMDGWTNRERGGRMGGREGRREKYSAESLLL